MTPRAGFAVGMLPGMKKLMKQRPEDSPEGFPVRRQVANIDGNFPFQSESVVPNAKVAQPGNRQPINADRQLRDVEFKLQNEPLRPFLQQGRQVPAGPFLRPLVECQILINAHGIRCVLRRFVNSQACESRIHLTNPPMLATLRSTTRVSTGKPAANNRCVSGTEVIEPRLGDIDELRQAHRALLKKLPGKLFEIPNAGSLRRRRIGRLSTPRRFGIGSKSGERNGHLKPNLAASALGRPHLLRDRFFKIANHLPRLVDAGAQPVANVIVIEHDDFLQPVVFRLRIRLPEG